VSESLVGSRINKQEVKEKGGLYKAYVQMIMPLGEANRLLSEKIKNNQLLYQRFRASQAYQDLNKEVEKYEEWKKQQNQ
jgi:predicted site-specific integrase-resolvase